MMIGKDLSGVKQKTLFIKEEAASVDIFIMVAWLLGCIHVRACKLRMRLCLKKKLKATSFPGLFP